MTYNNDDYLTADGIDIRDASGVIDPHYDLSLRTEMLPNLWMGGTDYNDRTEYGIVKPFITIKQFDSVYTFYGNANPVDWLVEEYRYAFYDSEEHPLDIARLRRAVDLAYADWTNGKRVLIRCQAGLNRSGLVTALVLMRAGFTAQDAIDRIRNVRDPQCLYNKAFVKFLHEQDLQDWVDPDLSDSE
jgi:protein-tyrosine phosphatase